MGEKANINAAARKCELAKAGSHSQRLPCLVFSLFAQSELALVGDSSQRLSCHHKAGGTVGTGEDNTQAPAEVTRGREMSAGDTQFLNSV